MKMRIGIIACGILPTAHVYFAGFHNFNHIAMQKAICLFSKNLGGSSALGFEVIPEGYGLKTLITIHKHGFALQLPQ